MKKRLLKADKHRLATDLRMWLPEEIESLKAHMSERPRKNVAWLAALYRRNERNVERMIERIERDLRETDPLAGLSLK